MNAALGVGVDATSSGMIGQAATNMAQAALDAGATPAQAGVAAAIDAISFGVETLGLALSPDQVCAIAGAIMSAGNQAGGNGTDI
jgi:hypothetical protein